MRRLTLYILSLLLISMPVISQTKRTAAKSSTKTTTAKKTTAKTTTAKTTAKPAQKQSVTSLRNEQARIKQNIKKQEQALRANKAQVQKKLRDNGIFQEHGPLFSEVADKWVAAYHPDLNWPKEFTDKGYQLVEEYADKLIKNGVLRLNDNDGVADLAFIGPQDMKLAQTLIKSGPEHRKFLRQIFVSVDITAPLYWY